MAVRNSGLRFALSGLLLLVALALVSPAVGAPKTTPARIARHLVAKGAPGALVVVRTASHMHRAAAGFADVDARVRLKATDLFRVASVTKTFVATVVLQLVAEGTLHVSDSVERWLPGLVSNGEAITLRELLSHTSGLYNYTDDPGLISAVEADPTRTWTARELVAIATAHLPLFPPGIGWSYSNTNYILLGLVVEAATGQTLEQELDQRIFRRLKLTGTSFPIGLAFPGSYAHGYIGRATLPGTSGLIDISGLLNPTWLWAAGAIVSSGDDVTRFYAALLGGRLLPPSLLAAMRRISPQSPGLPYDYGLGLMRFGTACALAYGHIGDYNGYRTIVYGRRNGKRVAIVMVNIDPTHVSWPQLEAATESAFCST